MDVGIGQAAAVGMTASSPGIPRDKVSCDVLCDLTSGGPIYIYIYIYIIRYYKLS